MMMTKLLNSGEMHSQRLLSICHLPGHGWYDKSCVVAEGHCAEWFGVVVVVVVRTIVFVGMFVSLLPSQFVHTPIALA
jgi:hypothetical protein